MVRKSSRQEPSDAPSHPVPELTPEQKSETERIFAALQQAATDDLRALADLLATKDESNTSGKTEYDVRDIVLRIGATAIETALAGREKGIRRVQPHPSEVLRIGPLPTLARQGYRDGSGVGAGEPGVLPLQALPCGSLPAGCRVGVDHGGPQPGATEAVALAGALGSVAEATEKILPKLSGPHLSESTVERTTERVGEEVGKRLGDGQTFGAKRPWTWSKDAQGK